MQKCDLCKCDLFSLRCAQTFAPAERFLSLAHSLNTCMNYDVPNVNDTYSGMQTFVNPSSHYIFKLETEGSRRYRFPPVENMAVNVKNNIPDVFLYDSCPFSYIKKSRIHFFQTHY